MVFQRAVDRSSYSTPLRDGAVVSVAWAARAIKPGESSSCRFLESGREVTGQNRRGLVTTKEKTTLVGGLEGCLSSCFVPCLGYSSPREITESATEPEVGLKFSVKNKRDYSM